MSRSGVARFAPRVTPSGVTSEGKKFVGKFTKNSGETRLDRSKKVWGDTLEGGDTRVKAIKSDSVIVTAMSKKGRQVFQEKIEG